MFWYLIFTDAGAARHRYSTHPEQLGEAISGKKGKRQFYFLKSRFYKKWF